MDWNRSETLALAAPACNICLGLGLRTGRHGATHPCNCVLRAIFRACFDRFRESVRREKYISRVTLDPLPGKDRRGSWGRKDEEFAADFCLVSKRTLTEAEHRIFRYHFLLGADWKQCCARLGMDRGNFFHAVYRIEQKLGRVFRELEPYSLFPVDDYFHGPPKDVSSCLVQKENVVPIRKLGAPPARQVRTGGCAEPMLSRQGGLGAQRVSVPDQRTA